MNVLIDLSTFKAANCDLIHPITGKPKTLMKSLILVLIAVYYSTLCFSQQGSSTLKYKSGLFRIYYKAKGEDTLRSKTELTSHILLFDVPKQTISIFGKLPDMELDVLNRPPNIVTESTKTYVFNCVDTNVKMKCKVEVIFIDNKLLMIAVDYTYTKIEFLLFEN